MKQLHVHWEALPRGLTVGNLVRWPFVTECSEGRANEERTIVTWTGTPEDIRQIVEANERMAFLLAVSMELARIESPQEVVCTAMARLRERLRRRSGDPRRDRRAPKRGSAPARVRRMAESRIDIARVPLEPFAALASESRAGTHDSHRRHADAISAQRSLAEELVRAQGMRAIVSAPLLEEAHSLRCCRR